jgi:hypothetical protein
MALTDWIDTLCQAWAFDAENQKTVISYRLVGEPKLPVALSPADQFPCALTIPYGMQTDTTGVDIYHGVTEFHVTPNKDFSHIPAMMKWFRLIKTAWLAAGLTLGGKVEYFIIDPAENSILGPIELQYGNESPHWGFTVRWIVKELTAVTVKA